MSRPFDRKQVLRFSILIYVLALAAIWFPGGRARRVELVFFHTNDIHGWIMPGPSREGESVGGMAALAAYLSRQRRPFLLLDAGDLYQGTPEGGLTKGESVVECMNVLKYDGSGVGNHEFDDGVAGLEVLTERAQFPFLAANLAGPFRLRIKPWVLKEIEGVKVGIFGLANPQTPDMSFEKNVAGVRFEDAIVSAKRAVAELEQEGAHVIVALSHLGLESKERDFAGDRSLAEAVPGIDVIIGGHTHIPLQRLQRVGESRIVQAGSRLRSVGRLRLVWDSGSQRILSWNYRLIPLSPARWGQDPAMKSLVDYYAETASRLLEINLDENIGRCERVLRRNRYGESLLGNWETDVMREASGADVALQNSGGIREDMFPGDIRVRDLYQIAPFPNTLVVMDLPGGALRNILEHGVSGQQGILQVSGLRMEFIGSAPVGSRVVSVSVDGVPLDEEKRYRVATNSFLAQGGDGYEAFKEGRNVKDTGRKLLDVFIENVRKNGTVTAELDGRIRRL